METGFGDVTPAIHKNVQLIIKIIMVKIFNLIAIAALLSGCKTGDAAQEAVQAELRGSWEITDLRGNKPKTIKPVRIEFSENNRVNGFLGCNTVRGTYMADTKNQRIKLNGLATTRMTCPDQNFENEMTKALEDAANFIFEDGKLMLSGEDRSPLATFKKISHPEVTNKYWKLVQLDGKAVTMEASQQQEQYFILRSDGTVNGFAGCNNFTGAYQINEGNRIRFDENMAATMRACPDLGFNERGFLEVFRLAESYTVSGDTLHLIVGKRMPLAVFEAVYF
ncbi:META domain-containing protein [Kaistella treverensis]|nr:META domain-containing protein [Kaistella treverensis]